MITIVNADARKIPLADGSVQMVITSPPYFNAREEYASWPTYQAYLDDMARTWAECWRVLCDGGRIAVNTLIGYDRPGTTGGYKPIEADTTKQLQAIGFELRGHLIWNKMGLASQNAGTAWGSWMSASNPSLRDEAEIIIVAHKGSAGREKGISTITRDDFLDFTRNVWDIKPAPESWHPAPFPPEIPRRLIELYTYLGDTVLDPFSGSGTTVKVAHDLGRNGIGIDLSLEYLRKSDGDRLALEYWQAGKGRRAVGSVLDLPLFNLEA